jgi:phage baseplate assembly protein V
MSDDEDQSSYSASFDYNDRTFVKMHQSLGRVTLAVSDDSMPMQRHQVTGYVGEVRDHKQRIGEFGLTSVPLSGAIAAVSYQFGDRGWATVVGVEDPRYRPVGLNPGEAAIYGVDGAAGNGTGGTMWKCLQALLGKIAKLLGVTIIIGDGTTQTITITTNTLNIAAQNLNFTSASGDITVNGVSLVHHVHSNSGGTGDGGPPVAS